MNECRLCLGLGDRISTADWNNPLLRSPNFFVVPSLGALIEGWLLLVPREHAVSMGVISKSIRAEFQSLKSALFQSLSKVYGRVCAFEHGPWHEGRSVGCGVDHAHLHVLPFSGDLTSAVSPLLPEGVFWRQGDLDDCHQAVRDHRDYLYIEQELGHGMIATHDKFESQIVRRAIAATVGLQLQFNWREFPQEDTVRSTIRALRHADLGLSSNSELLRADAS